MRPKSVDLMDRDRIADIINQVSELLGLGNEDWVGHIASSASAVSQLKNGMYPITRQRLNGLIEVIETHSPNSSYPRFLRIAMRQHLSNLVSEIKENLQ